MREGGLPLCGKEDCPYAGRRTALMREGGLPLCGKEDFPYAGKRTSLMREKSSDASVQ